jgi:hypothetical protein
MRTSTDRPRGAAGDGGGHDDRSVIGGGDGIGETRPAVRDERDRRAGKTTLGR